MEQEAIQADGQSKCCSPKRQHVSLPGQHGHRVQDKPDSCIWSKDASRFADRGWNMHIGQCHSRDDKVMPVLYAPPMSAAIKVCPASHPISSTRRIPGSTGGITRRESEGERAISS